MGSEEKNIDTLSSVLFNQKRLNILEVLLDSQDRKFTVSELQDLSGVSKPVVISFVDKMNRLGVVSKEKKGNMYLVSINRENRYRNHLEKILELDTEPLKEASQKLAEKIDKMTDQEPIIILFGSVARGNPGIDSDIDILVSQEKINKEENKIRETIEKENLKGYSFSPLFMDLEELVERIESGDSFIQKIMEDGKILKGEKKWSEIAGKEL